jgi:cellulose biosynthesis protein BcsQ
MKKIKILVSHQKGGVGKSTIATNLAGYFAEVLKLKTCLIDFDSQNSASNWIDTINKPELLDVSRFSNIARSGNSLNYPAIRMHLRNKARDYEVIIADMTWSNHLNCQIIPDFDLLLVPTSLSEMDIDSLIDWMNVLKPFLAHVDAPQLILCPNKIHQFQKQFESLAAQRFPVSFLMAPPIRLSKTIEKYFQKSLVVYHQDSPIHDSFTHFCKMILAAMEFKISKHNVIKDTKPVASLISHIESKSTAPVDTLKINSIIPQFLRR